MKKVTLFFSALCLSLASLADDYKIMQMNTPSIKIGKQICKTGDIFNDADLITWSNEKQAIKAMNLNTKQIKLFVAKVFSNVQAKSVKDYFLKNSRLSTRGSMVSFTDLAEELSDTIYLFDMVRVESPVKIDSVSSYLISYNQNGENKWRTLASTDKYFFLHRELFEEIDSRTEFTTTLFFRKKNIEDYLISADIMVVLLPLSINE